MSTNYTNRKVDLHVFPDEGTEQNLVSPSFGNRGKVCTGIVKLVQQVIMRLLSHTQIRANSIYGTDLISDLKTGIVQDEASLVSSISAAELAIRSQLNNEYSKLSDSGQKLQKDEVLASLTLKTYQLGADSVSISFVVESVAGNTREVVIPISLVF
jgi:hypothetical protein